MENFFFQSYAVYIKDNYDSKVKFHVMKVQVSAVVQVELAKCIR